MRQTWFLLEDGTAVDPNECAPDEAGALVHQSGAKVAMRSHDCPMSTGVDVDEAPTAKEVEPARPKRGYKTRESKAS